MKLKQLLKNAFDKKTKPTQVLLNSLAAQNLGVHQYFSAFNCSEKKTCFSESSSEKSVDDPCAVSARARS